MRVRFWGTRGSIASPGPETQRYGGNTSCVEVRPDDGTVLIFDCGTGARKLGLALAQEGPVRVHLLLGHTHADHIQGLPFFLPVFLPGSQITVYGPAGIDRDLPGALGGQMEYAYFPVPMQDLPADIRFVELGETEFSIGDVRVRTQFLNHTAPCLGYRVEAGGRSLVYSTDHESYAAVTWRPDRPAGSYAITSLLHPGDRRHAGLLVAADLVIHDAQYTEAEYPQKVGWGHSTVEHVVDMALAANVERLALFHHDPGRDDDAVDDLVAQARARVASAGRDLKVLAAAEGETLTLEEQDAATTAERAPEAPSTLLNARILVADDDETTVRLLEAVLKRDGCSVVWARNGKIALEIAQSGDFDLILLDVQMPEMDGHQTSRALRADPRFKNVPIVMLSALAQGEDVMAGFAQGVTDYMTKPFAVSQVRARVHSWLARSAEQVP